MKKVRFEILTKPHGKKRHRSTNRGISYNPKENIVFENLVRLAYVNVSDEYFTGPVKLWLHFYFSVPSGYTKKQRELIATGVMKYTKKPDLDNCVKAVKDGLNIVAWKDDSQVIQTYARKSYGDRDSIIVTIIGD